MTRFELSDTVEILFRTPAVLETWLVGLPERWVHENEGGDTFSPYDVVGHLIHGEKTDWMVRARQILEGRGDEPFEPFDRFAMRDAPERPLRELVNEFAVLRQANLAELRAMELTDTDLDRPGLHPELGRVTLRQLLATWAAHDLGHLRQIGRCMAKQYRSEVGPWRAYMRVMEE